MLKAAYYITPSDMDQVIFAKLLPADHYLRRLKAAIDFEPLRALAYRSSSDHRSWCPARALST